MTKATRAKATRAKVTKTAQAKRAECRCGWEYVALLGGVIPVHPNALHGEALCECSMKPAPKRAPVRDGNSTKAHLIALAGPVAALLDNEPPRHPRGSISPEARDDLDAEWAAYRETQRIVEPILNEMNTMASRMGIRGWRVR